MTSLKEWIKAQKEKYKIYQVWDRLYKEETITKKEYDLLNKISILAMIYNNDICRANKVDDVIRINSKLKKVFNLNNNKINSLLNKSEKIEIYEESTLCYLSLNLYCNLDKFEEGISLLNNAKDITNKFYNERKIREEEKNKRISNLNYWIDIIEGIKIYKNIEKQLETIN